jgi:Animal haem peroxidase
VGVASITSASRHHQAFSATSSACALNASFGRMFPNLPSASFAESDLRKLAEASIETSHADQTGKSKLIDDINHVPAGYTYTGQFIDHDIVLDPRPNDLTTPVDPSSLTNSRTPQLDLDSVYGAGPTGSPAMYESDGMHLLLGEHLNGASSDPGARDLVRDDAGQAIIGDPRNDENRIVGSLHSIFTRFHNVVVDQIRADSPNLSNSEVFAKAKQQVTWHYQWAVLTDFLPTIVGDKTAKDVATHAKSGWNTNLRFYNPCSSSIPVEFAVAAYRFGHSMVRDSYDINDGVHSLPVFTSSFNPNESLVGFQPSPSDFAIDWNLFFPLTGKKAPKAGPQVQNAYKIDNSLVPALRLIPGPAAGSGPTILSTRNLLRGQQLGLPTGEDVARAMGEKPLDSDKILVGPAIGKNAPDLGPVASVSPAFAGKTPLWTYVLAEAVASTFKLSRGTRADDANPQMQLGPVGGRIVAETLVGLMAADPNSVLNNPDFMPDARYGADKDKFLIQDIVTSGTELSN